MGARVKVVLSERLLLLISDLVVVGRRGNLLEGLGLFEESSCRRHTLVLEVSIEYSKLSEITKATQRPCRIFYMF